MLYNKQSEQNKLRLKIKLKVKFNSVILKFKWDPIKLN